MTDADPGPAALRGASEGRPSCVSGRRSGRSSPVVSVPDCRPRSRSSHPLLEVVDAAARASSSVVGRLADASSSTCLQAVVELGHVLGAAAGRRALLEVVEPLGQLDAATLRELRSRCRALCSLVVRVVGLDQRDHARSPWRRPPRRRRRAASAAGCGGRSVGGGLWPRRRRGRRAAGGTRRRVARQAATRYCSQAAGIVGVATWMKIVELGRLRLARGHHVRLPRQPVALAPVAGRAAGDDVVPGRRAALRARDHVVDGQVAALVAAVLAGPAVAGEHRAAGDLAPVGVARDPHVGQQPDHDRPRRA